VRPKVLFISGRETEYIRNHVLIAGLRQSCDVTIFTATNGNIVTRSLKGILKWIVYRPIYDIAMSGFYGQLIAMILSVIQNKPVVLDAYVSTYETLCEDRKLFHPRSPIGRLAYWIDQKSCQLSSLIITDTQAHARYLSRQFGIPEEKLRVIYVGCDESIFYPRLDVYPTSSYCEVFYYSSFLPLHGVDTIIQAAVLLKNRNDIRFTIGGKGPEFGFIRKMIEKLDIKNVDLVGWIPLEQLPLYIARATICLGGHFSKVPKATRVISTKTFQFIAMRKPTIVGDSEAIREIFTHLEHVYTVPTGNPIALAEAIACLADNKKLRDDIAAGGFEVFQKMLTTRAIGSQLISSIEKFITK